MKKFLLILLCIAAMFLFIGCSWLDSEPVGPKILGVTHIVDDNGSIYAEIDSVRYPVDYVFIGETHPRFGGDITVKPVNGMQVTVVEMTGNNSAHQGIQFMLGEWHEAQIEDAFRQNYTFGFVALGIILLLVVGVMIMLYIEDKRQTQKHASNANT